MRRHGVLRRRYGHAKQAFHYVAHVKGAKPTRFFRESGTIADSAARAFSGWTQAPVTLWPTHVAGEYRAAWYDPFSETNRETTLTILEEAAR